jgi:hypothetical protein
MLSSIFGTPVANDLKKRSSLGYPDMAKCSNRAFTVYQGEVCQAFQRYPWKMVV